MSKPDPQAVGEWLLRYRKIGDTRPLTEIADNIPWDRIPQIKSTSAVEETAAQYKRDLQRDAAQGNASARRLLVEHGWEVPEVPERPNAALAHVPRLEQCTCGIEPRHTNRISGHREGCPLDKHTPMPIEWPDVLTSENGSLD